MHMTGRELVRSAIRFKGVDRLPRDFPPEYGSDMFWCRMQPDVDSWVNLDLSVKSWTDEWGTQWARLGNSTLGEAKNIVIRDWSDLDRLQVPDVEMPARWKSLMKVRGEMPDTYLLGRGISLYFRASFLRGMENTWMDIYDHAEELCRLVDLLVGLDLRAIGMFKSIDCDGILISDDWGLQNSLQISPQKWREIWKPRYAKVFAAAHAAGMQTFMHSCGYIVDILDDLIEAGLDVINMDQQENMGLEMLGRRFSGRIAFYNPVDIQKTMVQGSPDEIRQYCREMVKHLHTDKGGFIPKWYIDPVGAGHRQEAIDAMCDEFRNISKELYGK
jgi:uroporphyrinogen decarboxylase